MSKGIRLIVGLGNPGSEYENTRHNVGACFVLDLVERLHKVLRFESKFQGFHQAITIDNQDVHLLIPATYMNLSGQAVQAVSRFYKIEADAILVVHDELDLAIGDIRLKFDGGAGGHNGLINIIDHLKTKQFHRLRVGIGRPTHNKKMSDYVLSPPSKSDRELIQQSLLKAEKVLSLIVGGKYQQAMNQLHTL